MPTKREREYYRMGYTDGINTMQRGQPQILGIEPPELGGIFTPPKPNVNVNYQHGISLLKQIAESHALDIRTES